MRTGCMLLHSAPVFLSRIPADLSNLDLPNWRTSLTLICIAHLGATIEFSLAFLSLFAFAQRVSLNLLLLHTKLRVSSLTLTLIGKLYKLHSYATLLVAVLLT